MLNFIKNYIYINHKSIIDNKKLKVLKLNIIK